MTKATRKISYEEFAADPATVLDEVAQRDETVLVEHHGRTYAVTIASKEVAPTRTSPRMAKFDEHGNLVKVDPKIAREALRRSAGALTGVDIEKLKADLRIERQQDSSGRPG